MQRRVSPSKSWLINKGCEAAGGGRVAATEQEIALVSARLYRNYLWFQRQNLTSLKFHITEGRPTVNPQDPPEPGATVTPTSVM